MYSPINKTNMKTKNHKSSQLNTPQFVTLPVHQLQRNSVQVQNINTPVMYSLYQGKKRSTHNPELYYNKSGYLYPQMMDTRELANQSFPYYGSNVNFVPQPVAQPPVLIVQPLKMKSNIKPRQFMTNNNTPRNTADRNSQQKKQINPNYGYIIVDNPQNYHHAGHNSDNEQQYENDEYEDDKKPQEIISILSKENLNSISSKGQIKFGSQVKDRGLKNSLNSNQLKMKLPKVGIQQNNSLYNSNPLGYAEPRNSFHDKKQNDTPQVVNYVQNQRHSHKRNKHSEVGPVASSGLEAHGHRRLATTAEQHDQYSKTQTQEDQQLNNKPLDESHNNQQLYQDQQQQYQQYIPIPQMVHPQHLVQIPQMTQMARIQNQPQSQLQPILIYQNSAYNQEQQIIQPNFKKKGVKNIQRQIQSKLKDIQETIHEQTNNLNQHNKYLMEKIKKMRVRDQQQRALISAQSAQIQKLTQEKNAYMERCLHLQYQIANSQTSQLNKQFSILNIGSQPRTGEQSFQSSTATDANNETVNYHNIDTERQRQLRQHLKNTIPDRKKINKNPPVPTGTSVSPMTKNLKIKIEKSSSNELSNYLSNNTPHFSSNNESPTHRKPRLTAKVSNTSNGSDPSSTILHNQSGIMQESNSFGGCWINTNSGLSVVKTLHNHIPVINTINSSSHDESKKQREDSSEQNFSQTYPVETDNLAEVDKTGDHTQQVKLSPKQQLKKNEQILKQLYVKQQELIKQYNENPGVEARKRRLLISTDIKKLEAQIQKSKRSINGKTPKSQEQKHQSRSASRQRRTASQQKNQLAREKSQSKLNSQQVIEKNMGRDKYN